MFIWCMGACFVKGGHIPAEQRGKVLTLLSTVLLQAVQAFGRVHRGRRNEIPQGVLGCREMPRVIPRDPAVAHDIPGDIPRDPRWDPAASHEIPWHSARSLLGCRGKPRDPMGVPAHIPAGTLPSLGAHGMPWSAVELPRLFRHMYVGPSSFRPAIRASSQAHSGLSLPKHSSLDQRASYRPKSSLDRSTATYCRPRVFQSTATYCSVFPSTVAA